MAAKKLDQLVNDVENYVACWKQFNRFVTLARAKKFTPEDETEFLDTKSILIQQLELIMSLVELVAPSREEIHAVVGDAPSLRCLSELNEGAFRKLENQWHKIYIDWHALLGQLRVRQRGETSMYGLGSMFGKKG